MIKSNNYKELEKKLLFHILNNNEINTAETVEKLNFGFCLTKPKNNKNHRSNYEYANEFFKWILSGDTDLSDKIKKLNPFAEKFIDSSDLPENFSSTYGWKIKDQLPHIITELNNNPETRRAYINVLLNSDKIILGKKTTHEFPCTIGIQFLIRSNKLVMIVNMRSNNAWAVLPYDVYNFTELQKHVADKLKLQLGYYYHQVNSFHIYKKDKKKVLEFINS